MRPLRMRQSSASETTRNVMAARDGRIAPRKRGGPPSSRSKILSIVLAEGGSQITQALNRQFVFVGGVGVCQET